MPSPRQTSASTPAQPAEAQLRAVLRSLDYGILILDPDFVVLNGSPAAAAVLGTEIAPGTPLDQALPRRGFGKSGRRGILSAIRKGGAWEADLSLPGVYDDQPRSVHVILSAADERGVADGGFVLLARDVTESRERERRLLDSQRMESVGLLAGGIAHDFNNILMGILGYASLAADLVGAEHPARRMLATIEQSAERAASLTSQLMAYASGGKLSSAPIDMAELTAETLNILGSNLSSAITVHRDMGADVSNVLGDPSQLQQVVMNLVLNAGEAIVDRIRTQSADKATGNIWISTREVRLGRGLRTVFGGDHEPLAGRFVLTSVRDDGTGMDERTLRRIFEPFFTTKFTGRGLGLAAVQGIIHNHGGGLEVVTAPGQGTTFNVYLPATKRLADPARTVEPLTLEGTETVLIVDDEAVARQLGLLTLANLGYQVLLAASGEEGVETYRQYQSTISLVVLDLTMQGMSGHEVLAEFAMMERPVPVLLTSGYDESRVADLAEDRYMHGFLQKPYTPEALAKAVREILDGSGA